MKNSRDAFTHLKQLLLSTAMIVLGSAVAVTPVDTLDSDAFDGAVLTFLGTTASFDEVDADSLEAQVNALLPETGSVFLPAGELSPLAKALHAVVAHDGQPDRVRYEIGIRRVFVADQPAGGSVPVLLLNLERYNLGQLIRQELVDSIGAEHVAPAAEFGEGPHVAWRFVIREVMGHEALIQSASRTELTDEQAGLEACVGGDCLSTASLSEGSVPWHDFFPEDMGLTVPEFLASLPYAAEQDGVPIAAAVVDFTADLAWFDAYRSESADSDGVVARVSIEQNLGQDESIDVVLHQTGLLDDSLASLRTRVYGWNTGDGFPLLGAQAYECRRGEHDWVPVGEFCP